MRAALLSLLLFLVVALPSQGQRSFSGTSYSGSSVSGTSTSTPAVSSVAFGTYARAVAWGDEWSNSSNRWCGIEWTDELICWPTGQDGMTIRDALSGNATDFPGQPSLIDEIDLSACAASTYFPTQTTHVVIELGVNDYNDGSETARDSWDPTLCTPACSTQADELDWYVTQPLEAAVAEIKNCGWEPVLWTPSVRCNPTTDLNTCLSPWDPESRGALMSAEIKRIAAANVIQVVDVYSASLSLMTGGLFDDYYADSFQPNESESGGCNCTDWTCDDATCASHGGTEGPPNKHMAIFDDTQSYLHFANLARSKVARTALPASSLPTEGLVFRWEADGGTSYEGDWNVSPKLTLRGQDVDKLFWTSLKGVNPTSVQPEFHKHFFSTGRSYVEFSAEDISYKVYIAGRESTGNDGKGQYTLGVLPLGQTDRTMYYLFRTLTVGGPVMTGLSYGIPATVRQYLALGLNSSGKAGIQYGGAGGVHATSLSVNDNAWRILSVVIDAGTYEIFNGETSLLSGSVHAAMNTSETIGGAHVSFHIGSLAAAPADAAVALIYNIAHDAAARQSVVEFYETELGLTFP